MGGERYTTDHIRDDAYFFLKVRAAFPGVP